MLVYVSTRLSVFIAFPQRGHPYPVSASMPVKCVRQARSSAAADSKNSRSPAETNAFARAYCCGISIRGYLKRLSVIRPLVATVAVGEPGALSQFHPLYPAFAYAGFSCVRGRRCVQPVGLSLLSMLDGGLIRTVLLPCRLPVGCRVACASLWGM